MTNDSTYTRLLNSNHPPTRQELIKKIQDKLNTKLITYTAAPNNPFAIINRDDLIPFEDLLRSISDSKHLTLMIHSPGGEPNAAEKILMLFRERFVNGFDVIIPDYAKSAATMVALGSDKIFMGHTSELGPIDPQIVYGNEVIPARAFIDGLEDIRKKIKAGDPHQIYFPMLSQIRPEIIQICENSIKDSREFAEKWLKQYMLKNDPKQAAQIAKMLSEGKIYKSHGKVINYKEAKDVLRLNIELIEAQELWDMIWELYCRSTIFLQQSRSTKLFESETVSLNIQTKILKLDREGSEN